MTRLDLHYVDPRLVALYDSDNPRGADVEFYSALAEQIQARTIVDLGCGTGLLTRALATSGRRVIGVDPASEMLAFARRQPGAERVEWVEGDSSALDHPAADLALMTGNVAQVFLDDDGWASTLRDIHAALRPGGHLAFESRNPDARSWESWTREATFERIDSPSGPLECWLDSASVHEGRVSFRAHNIFTRTGEVLIADSELRFRSRAEIADALAGAGFTVEQVYGGWHHEPLTAASRVMVFVARRS